MMWAVGARFGFGEAEIRHMPARRLAFWFEGHQYLSAEEEKLRQAMMSGGR